MTWEKSTCPLPHAPAICVLSDDQAMLNRLPVLGFSNEYDHWNTRTVINQQVFAKKILAWTLNNISAVVQQAY